MLMSEDLMMMSFKPHQGQNLPFFIQQETLP